MLRAFFHRVKYSIYRLFYAIFGLEALTAKKAFAIENPINSGTFEAVVAKIAELIARIGMVLVVVFIIYSGFLFVSARGSDEQLKKAKSTFMWTIIGAAIIIGAYAIAQAVINFAQQL